MTFILRPLSPQRSGTFGFGLEFTDFLDLNNVGAITVKGTTLHPRAGNKGQRIVETPSGILNCVGLEIPVWTFS